MDETRRLIERAQRTAEEARRVRDETRQLVRTSREIQNWTARVQGRIRGEATSFLSFNRQSNRLLGLLPAAEFERLVPLVQGVSCSTREILHRANSAIEYVYFPISGLLSATITMQNGDGIEVAPIGSEGMAGLTALAGDNKSPHDVVVQVPGYSLRIGVLAFQAELKRGGLLQDVVAGYFSAVAALSARQIACNGLHSVGKRCCRRLLSAQDRLASDDLPLTHEVLAAALGVRRASVTEELGALQKSGVIDSRRGHIRILDRAKLQSLACECYGAENEALARMFISNGIATRWPP